MSKIPSAAAHVLLLALAMLLSACGLGSANLRQSDGTLAPCDGGPHCVSSQDASADRHVEPLRYDGTREAAHQRLMAVLKTLPRVKVVTAGPDYVHAEASTALMHYVDDVEFVFSPREAKIDVRSSSRIGYYDFKTNRERVEAIRAAFAKAG